MWRATKIEKDLAAAQKISIHALRVEGDDRFRSNSHLSGYFYPRPPCGGRREVVNAALQKILISIHALRVEGDQDGTKILSFVTTISIHALRVEGDGAAFLYEIQRDVISIHALRVEGDRVSGMLSPSVSRFLSTPSVWRATGGCKRRVTKNFDFYPRPPCGGRLGLPVIRRGRFQFLSTPSVWRATLHGFDGLGKFHISIHALRVEGDFSMPPLRPLGWVISIHALRVEGDTVLLESKFAMNDFYPRPPCGGRRVFVPQWHKLGQLISIHALRVEGDLVCDFQRRNLCVISIHALRVEGDPGGPAFLRAT